MALDIDRRALTNRACRGEVGGLWVMMLKRFHLMNGWAAHIFD